MTDADVHAAALSDPDALPSTPEQLARMRLMSPAKRILLKLGWKQENFAKPFRVPLGTRNVRVIAASLARGARVPARQSAGCSH
jgi:hypothetical protein